MQKVLKVHPNDNIIVALQDLKKGDRMELNGKTVEIQMDVPQKHKYAEHDLAPGDEVRMYGVLVGKATQPIAAGAPIGTHNLQHAASDFALQKSQYTWQSPDAMRFANRTFMGYRRNDGQVGTQNIWLVIPMVFCETAMYSCSRRPLKKSLASPPPPPIKARWPNLPRPIAKELTGLSWNKWI
ncbi:MAG: altronate dehydratase [Cytophagales bacterium]|nr:altronate dehydratase [Cytophagales bacterium]